MGRHKSSGHHKGARKRKDGKLLALRRESQDNNLTEEEIDAEEERQRKLHQGPANGRSLLTSSSPQVVKSDLKLLQQAIRKGWNVRKKTAIRRRLEAIVQKTEANIIVKTKDDCFTIKNEYAADRLATQAARVLVSMDQADLNRIKAEEQPILPPQSATMVNVNVQVDARRIELARLAQRLGVSSLHIDGEQVPTVELLGTAVSASEEQGANGKARRGLSS